MTQGLYGLSTLHLRLDSHSHPSDISRPRDRTPSIQCIAIHMSITIPILPSVFTGIQVPELRVIVVCHIQTWLGDTQSVHIHAGMVYGVRECVCAI
ncbi:hypothetical protein EON63_24060 [archaeon]|nr:MAG: hypothetical protein EON63_24060 [archaeon]